MIERNLRYVTIRKYGTAFLEAFGMLPLDYFGCVGDNYTDNYANLQVAIDESIKRGLEFIFVPNGTYYYTGNLLNVDKIKFIGNSKYAKIYDGENEQKIYQIGMQMPFTKGNTSFSATVEHDGKVTIKLPVKSAVEAYVTIGDDIFYVTDDGLVTLNGSLFDDQVVSLGTNTTLSDISIAIDSLIIEYALSDTTGTVDISIDWRVR